MAAKKKDEPAAEAAVVEEKPAAKAAAAGPAVTEGHVHAEAREGVLYLVFGEVVPGEEETGFQESHSHAVTRDDAVGLINDLPTEMQTASAAAVHSG